MTLRTKEKILQTALTLFAEKGYHGVKTYDIAHTADIHHALIFHHFKTKENLWQAVKEFVEEQHFKKRPPLNTNHPFSVFLNGLIDDYISFYQENRHLLKIMVWQSLEMAMPRTPLGEISGSLKELSQAFTVYQKKGAFHPRINPKFVTLFILTSVKSYVDTLPPLLTNAEQKTYKIFMKERLSMIFDQH